MSPSDIGDPNSSTAIPWEELRRMPELNPPSVMPNGNVGTPLATYMDLIRTCKLPPRVIKKLRLEFPKGRSRKRYGAVGLDYGTGVLGGTPAEEESVREDAPHTRLESPEAEEERIPSVGQLTNIVGVHYGVNIQFLSCRTTSMMQKSGRDMRLCTRTLISRYWQFFQHLPFYTL